MAGTALKRLMAEYKQLTLNPPEGIVAGPVNEENFFEWEALIMGPEDTCFEGGVFPAILSFPSDYPSAPEDEIHLRNVPPQHIPGRPRVHLHPARPRRRPHGLREQRRALEPRAERGEDPAVRGQHAGRAERRERSQR
ncbi:hypothetical protein ANANG_G00063160 [Anguilla anguilla]|uniref:UBC core domain-containing protein n=1 Tax=Anguilla anguilla TaxID=7936 RepID=A0A9D3S761_ANGAN|nr:hypothetical protein ANANG_G00063160 [Anguilla anguilla]